MKPKLESANGPVERWKGRTNGTGYGPEFEPPASEQQVEIERKAQMLKQSQADRGQGDRSDEMER